MHVRLINIGSGHIAANLSFIRPPGFSINPQYENVTLAPISYSDLNFQLSAPQLSNSAFTIGVVASYVMNGTEYSTFRTFVVGQQAAPPGSLSLSTIVEIGFVVLIVIVAILVLVAAMRRKRRNHHDHTKGESHS